jgi:asparagine N-glycosylation enzyme membrane subunit Stt3
MEQLLYHHKEDIKKRLQEGTFSEVDEISKIMQLGHDETVAVNLLTTLIKEYKQELYFNLKEEKEKEEKGNIATTVAVVSSLLVAVMGQNNVLLLLLSIVVAVGAGYIGFPDKPIAAIVGFVTGAILMPVVVGFYLSGRSSFFTLEMIIPMALSFGPGLLIKYLISRYFYNDLND